MAEGQGDLPQIEPGEPVVAISNNSTESAEGQERSEHVGVDPGHAVYWCYQCNKEVTVEPERDGDPESMVCIECQSGFVEALATAQTVPDVRRAQRRRRRRGTTAAGVVAAAGPGATPAHQMVPLTEALEHLYPQHLMQVLQLFGHATNRPNVTAAAAQDQETAGSVDGRIPPEGPILDEAHHPLISQNNYPTLTRSSGELQAEGQVNRAERPASEDPAESLIPAAAAEALERLAQEGRMLLIRRASPGRGDDGAELVVSETETEEGMRLEFDPWDSADEEEDEEEWEEVDEDEEAAGVGEDGSAAEENDAEPQDVDQSEEQQGEELQPRVREFRLRTRNTENNLHQYLQQLLQNLVGQNVEVRVELPNGPLYVGNPGDYVDARGFEQLLQQMAENDNSRRGAPPAAKSAVECLPSIAIEQRHLDDGSAVCAICKDIVALGEPAKQLPCLHLYHNDCILPWLTSRNSCPVCRYELPTDDPDYEEQKQSRGGTVHNTGSQSPSLELEQPEGQEGGTGDGNDAQNTSGQQHQRGARGPDIGEISNASNSGNGGGGQQQSSPAEEEQGHHCDTSECSNLQGSESAISNPPQSSDEGRVSVSRENESDEVGRRETFRGTGRGWFLLAAGPVLSMMGLVLVLCIGNHLIGGRMQHLGRPLQRQQHPFFQEAHIEHIGVADEVQGRRRWWMPFQR